MARKYLSLTEFLDAGYVMEVNRQFLHPLGLALEVDPNKGTIRVWDNRDDPEGMRYELGLERAVDIERKAASVDRLWATRAAVRLAALGYVVQPLADMSRPVESPSGRPR